MTSPTIVTTQAELDAALTRGDTSIHISSPAGICLQVTTTGSSSVTARGSSSVTARDSSRVTARDSSRVTATGSSSVTATGSSSVMATGSSSVTAWDSSSVTARDSSSVTAWDSSSVTARDSSRVTARDSSRVTAWDSSSVTATGSSSVMATGSSSVTAWDSSSADARDSSRVTARDSSSVDAWDSSSVTARDSSSVTARDSSRVTARDSSRVTARDSSSVTASPMVAIHRRSTHSVTTGGVVIDCTNIDTDPTTWAEYHGLTVSGSGVVTVYKAVDDNWTTPRGTSYAPGREPSCDDWTDNNTCGGGLHFSPTPREAREYHPRATRYVAVGVRVDELRPIPGGVAKCKAPRVVRGCVEVDIDGQPI